MTYLADSKKEPDSHKARESLHDTLKPVIDLVRLYMYIMIYVDTRNNIGVNLRRDSPPRNHHDRNESRRLQHLKNQVRRHFEDSIRDEKDGAAQVVLSACQLEIFFKADDSRISHYRSKLG